MTLEEYKTLKVGDEVIINNFRDIYSFNFNTLPLMKAGTKVKIRGISTFAFDKYDTHVLAFEGDYGGYTPMNFFDLIPVKVKRFEIGDKVKIKNSSNYSCQDTGGGKVVGHKYSPPEYINASDSLKYHYRVRFDSKVENSYRNSDLELVEEEVVAIPSKIAISAITLNIEQKQKLWNYATKVTGRKYGGGSIFHFPDTRPGVCTSSEVKPGYFEVDWEYFSKHILKKTEHIAVEKEFVLPEKWAVAITFDNKSILTKWRNQGINSLSYDSVGYLTSGKVWIGNLKSDYSVISFENFLKYVYIPEIDAPTVTVIDPKSIYPITPTVAVKKIDYYFDKPVELVRKQTKKNKQTILI